MFWYIHQNQVKRSHIIHPSPQLRIQNNSIHLHKTASALEKRSLAGCVVSKLEKLLLRWYLCDVTKGWFSQWCVLAHTFLKGMYKRVSLPKKSTVNQRQDVLHTIFLLTFHAPYKVLVVLGVWGCCFQRLKYVQSKVNK